VTPRVRRGAAGALLGAAALAALTGAAPMTYAMPEEPEVALPAGPGEELVRNNCAACHSLDYIVRQPTGMPVAFWEASVAKMVNAYGADIAPGDQKAIAEYLAKARAG
jgi:mono/diheme cytochrome c family protein